jgi:hypothetical protein
VGLRESVGRHFRFTTDEFSRLGFSECAPEDSCTRDKRLATQLPSQKKKKERKKEIRARERASSDGSSQSPEANVWHRERPTSQQHSRERPPLREMQRPAAIEHRPQK